MKPFTVHTYLKFMEVFAWAKWQLFDIYWRVLFVCLCVSSTVRSTAFTTKDIVVSGSDDRTVKVRSLHCRGVGWR